MPRVDHWFWGVVKQAWPIYAEVLLASLLINIFALVTPLYTMNVYDRVVPNNAMDSLVGLTIGLVLVLIFDFVLKLLRAYFVENLPSQEVAYLEQDQQNLSRQRPDQD